MGSTVRSLTKQVEAESSPSATIRWRSWPLTDAWRWSWLLPIVLLCVGGAVAWLSDSWLAGLIAVAALTVAMWQFLLPITYEICSLGVRRYAFGRMRLVRWSAIGAFQLRTTGVIFFQRTDPTIIDVMSGYFVPYPSDEDEAVVAVRLYLPNATELP